MVEDRCQYMINSMQCNQQALENTIYCKLHQTIIEQHKQKEVVDNKE